MQFRSKSTFLKMLFLLGILIAFLQDRTALNAVNDLIPADVKFSDIQKSITQQEPSSHSTHTKTSHHHGEHGQQPSQTMVWLLGTKIITKRDASGFVLYEVSWGIHKPPNSTNLLRIST